MLFMNISLNDISLLSHGMNSYTVVSILKSICRIGMMMVNENMLNTAERMLNTILPTIDDLYGAAYCLSIFQNSFIYASCLLSTKSYKDMIFF